MRRRVAWLVPLALAGVAPARAGDGIVVAQLVRQRMILRVETQTIVAPAVTWKESKGPRCVSMAQVLAAGVVAPASVDFILRGGARVRARFSKSCPALAYYSGFYVAPNPDGMMCADRDTVRDRAGGECEIARFRSLQVRH